jgi:hypothetical protein
MREDIFIYDGYEYRIRGGEIHRRLIKTDKNSHLEGIQFTWLVLNHSGDYIPGHIKAHYEQAKDKNAVN